MKYTLLLAWRYMSFHRIRSIVMVLCIALVFYLPIAVQLLVHHYSKTLGERARVTPLLAGAVGSRFDLLFNSLYFKGEVERELSMADVERVREGGLGTPIPLAIKYSARKFPIVGTNLDYFALRGLTLASGVPPMMLGDAAIGSEVAAALDLKPGSYILSDDQNLYDISAAYPLRMKVVGVLNRTGTPDDWAVIVDVKTTWVIGGIGHGHQKSDELNPDAVLGASESNVTLNASVVEYNEITPENINTFHFHGDPKTFPITAMIIDPKDRKSATILKGRFAVWDEAQLVVPDKALGEVMDLILRIKRFFDANSVLVSLAMLMFLLLVILLSLRIRQREMETMFKIGCDRTMVFWLQSVELCMVMFLGIAIAAVLSGVSVLVVVEMRMIL